MKISRSLFIGATVTATAMFFSGCQGANVSAQMRTPMSHYNMETRCVEVDMRDNKEMAETFKKYDGWRVFYISEYTTENRMGTDGSVCFERPREQ